MDREKPPRLIPEDCRSWWIKTGHKRPLRFTCFPSYREFDVGLGRYSYSSTSGMEEHRPNNWYTVQLGGNCGLNGMSGWDFYVHRVSTRLFGFGTPWAFEFDLLLMEYKYMTLPAHPLR
jgi:hypothetical protein